MNRTPCSASGIPPEPDGGVVLGLDYGERRIGVAKSDALGIIASALCVLDARAPGLLGDIRRLCDEHRVVRIVLGLPLHMNGAEGASAAAARKFGETLSRTVRIPVVFSDERMSTLTAQRALLEGNERRERRRELVDKVAAQVLLQHYLDCRSPSLPPEEGDA